MFNFDSRDKRDPARHQRVLDLLCQVWLKYPQLRLGQLLVNIDARFERNPFFVEDDEVEASIRKVLDVGFGKG